ncbi:MAG: CRISPR-associated helicase Cas3' [Muribaculaceae bacterium]|nr:CRISPR-associated helicase Cas3' [Muribaculaceae bacterium]
MKQPVISHLYQDLENGKWIIQTNIEHQLGVARLSASFAKQFGLPTWGYVLGLLHDKGKESNAFQQYIRMVNGLYSEDNNKYDNHYHAYVGGIIAHNIMGKSVLNLIANQILSHHTGLHDYTYAEDILDKTPLPAGVNVTDIDIDKSLLIKELINSELLKTKENDIYFHHLSRMLFSCLVDADRLDTELFMNKESWCKRGCDKKIAELLPILEMHIKNLQLHAPNTFVNRTRKWVMEQCVKISSGGKGFYSLTVPTGGGKTLSSLIWAMKHAVTNNMNRIIIAIPYTSIIMQTAALLKHIFGEENVLEHHGGFDPDVIKDENMREKAKLATENWDYPIIVTTNVQLFESIFSNSPSKCRKLHNIVNSVIILDEVQTLPTDFLQPVVDAINAYKQMFGVSFLFSTASQPVLSGLIEGVNKRTGFKGLEHITEIIPSGARLHEKLLRVKINIDNSEKNYDDIAAIISGYDKVLCIVNTRKDAKELFDRLSDDGIKLHLSRMMCPAHISKTLDLLKSLLANGTESVIRVISTQLVEAGVDIDFPVVLRQESGLDSILQAAGRCNREGRLDIGNTIVFSLGAEGRNPFGNIADANNARLSLAYDSDWLNPLTMDQYFRQLYSRKNTFDKKNIKYYLYKPDEMCFETAAKEFSLIDDNSIDVIVNWGDSMCLIEQLKATGPTYGLMKQLSRYMVGIRLYDFKQLVESGAIEEPLEGLYVVRDSAQYDHATGLSLSNRIINEVLMI